MYSIISQLKRFSYGVIQHLDFEGASMHFQVLIFDLFHRHNFFLPILQVTLQCS